MSTDILKEFDTACDKLAKVKTEIAKSIVGQETVVDLSLTAILAGGHALLVGAPGLAKTRLVNSLGTVLGLSHNRIQCTPDLMPSDILGSEILEEDSKTGKRGFKFIEGPVFTNLLMADEINRASPRTQSALLQAMQEHQVSIAGATRKLSEPFHVLATQNPIEQEGTYPLPEAQLDRFLLQIDVAYPTFEEEKQLVLATTSKADEKLKAIISQSDLEKMQGLVRKLPITDEAVEIALKLVRATRPQETENKFVNEYIDFGAGPRAAQSLVSCAKAYALIKGKEVADATDVHLLLESVLKHRIGFNFSAKAQGVTFADLMEELEKVA